jgi:hypothetical protein
VFEDTLCVPTEMQNVDVTHDTPLPMLPVAPAGLGTGVAVQLDAVTCAGTPGAAPPAAPPSGAEAPTTAPKTNVALRAKPRHSGRIFMLGFSFENETIPASAGH